MATFDFAIIWVLLTTNLVLTMEDWKWQFQFSAVLPFYLPPEKRGSKVKY